MRNRSVPLLAAGFLAVAVLLAACDVGDGTTLRDPSPDAPPATDVAPGTDETSSTDGVAFDTLASVPVDAGPTTTDPTARTLPAPAAGAFSLTAPWATGGVIDQRYGCDGSNAAPPLAWNGVPDGTVELAIALVNESDLSRGRPFAHWVMTGIDPSLPGLAENDRPVGTSVGLNFFGNVGYDGPCPTPGDTHVLRLTLYALNQQLEVADELPAAEMLDAIDAVAFDERSVTGSSTR
ncbi:MAG: YbhB/YbcL family Raf kinase inhibitor-like protein [Actinomycetota bacterium]